MTRPEPVREVAARTGLPPPADAAVKAVPGAVSDAPARGEAVQPAGFGAFGASISVPASRSVSFQAGKGLRDVVNRASG